MASLFRPWTNTAFRVGVVVFLAGAAALVVAPMVWVRTPWQRNQYVPVDQPVQFDHRHHVQDDGINCVYCHYTVYRSWTAGIPSTDKCMGCHGQIWNRSPMLEVVRRSYFSGAPIPWNRVHDLPGFAYFNHAIHVNKGVGCSTCHGRVDQMGLVYQVAPLTMGWCLDCHRDPAKSLRPPDQITNMAWRPEDGLRPITPELAAELDTRRLTDCFTCHR